MSGGSTLPSLGNFQIVTTQVVEVFRTMDLDDHLDLLVPTWAVESLSWHVGVGRDLGYGRKAKSLERLG